MNTSMMTMKEIRIAATKIKPASGTTLLEDLTVFLSNTAAELAEVPGNAKACFIVKRAQLRS